MQTASKPGETAKLAVVDRNLCIVWASTTIAAQTSSQAAVGRRASEVLADGVKIEEWVQQAFSSGATINVVKHAGPEQSSENGHSPVYRIECHPLMDHHGEVNQVAVLIQDVTEEIATAERAKAAEEDALRRQQQLETLRQQRDVLAQVLSTAAVHESFEDLCMAICQKIRTFFGADRCWLISQREGDEKLHVIAEDTHPDWPGAYAAREDVDVAPMRELWSKVIASREPLAFDENSPEAHNLIFRKYNIRSHLTVSVRPAEGHVWVFGMHQCSYPRVWTEEEKAFLNALGHAVAIMLEREQTSRAAEEQRRQIYKDVVYAVTMGKMVIREPGELSQPEHADISESIQSASDITAARRSFQQWLFSRVPDIPEGDMVVLAIGEAITNAWKHAGGGRLFAWLDKDAVYALIMDNGRGIEPGMLTMATLMPGFSTQVSLGIGFTIMLKAASQLQLATGPNGTAVQMQFPISGQSASDAPVAKYWNSAGV